MNAGIADMNLIKKTLNDFTSNSISKGTGINLSTIKKLKSGERSVEKLRLKYGDNYRLVNYLPLS